MRHLTGLSTLRPAVRFASVILRICTFIVSLSLHVHI